MGLKEVFVLYLSLIAEI